MRIPRSTYRLQLHADFGFQDAARIVPYLARLGVSELYLSPIFQATPGSTHGYDVLDQSRLSPELGGEPGFEQLSATAAANGIGVTVDFVPNHMGVGCDGNRYWDDVLKHGPVSEFAEFFDIDWASPKSTLAGKLLLPILANQYGVCLEAGDVRLVWDSDSFRFQVSQRRLPLRPQSLSAILLALAEREPDSDDSRQLRDLAAELDAIAEPAAECDRASFRAALADIEARITALVGRIRASRGADAACLVEALNGRVGDRASFDFMDGVLRQQVYRLSSYHLALEAINYRRFFAVNELAAIRVELPRVFQAVHARLLELVRAGTVTGVRLDHIDGLYDPIAYLRQLQDSLRLATGVGEGEAPLHLTVEKILAPDEQLPESFVTHGTTGYEFIRLTTGLFVDQRAAARLTALYRRFSGDELDFAEHLRQSKHDILDSLLASDITMLSHELERLAESDRRSRDLTWRSLHQALLEVMSAFSIYRTYVRPDGSRTPDDEARINRALVQAIASYPRLGRAGYHFVRALLLNEGPVRGAEHFAMRFQQATGPVMAKSLEDTAFYRYARFICENEVGCRPDRVGVDAETFHAANAVRFERYPLALLASSTHDTKRGEDVRARLSMLSELPNTWRRVTLALGERARAFRVHADGEPIPSRIDEYFYYQTLVGAVPFGAAQVDFAALEERLQAYMLKACREGSRNTSWLYPNEEYERGLQQFVHASLSDPQFVHIVRRFCARIERYAAAKSLGQVALKSCAPGVPDTYQGAELWHQVLVDPDNRRPVDYGQREAVLARIDARRDERVPLVRALLESYEDGAIKLFVVSELLRLRNERPELFELPYAALDAGPCCFAFARGAGRAQLVCVVPRLPFQVTRGRQDWAIGSVWAEQALQGAGLNGRYRNAFTGQQLNASGELSLALVLADFPIAVLIAE